MLSELDMIKILLWEQWDPIGVNDCAGAYGEYDAYAKEIHSMLYQGATADMIARYLNYAADEIIGIGADEEISMMVAGRVVAIHAIELEICPRFQY